MNFNRLLLVAGGMVVNALGAQASAHPKPLTTAQTEARNEAAVPSFTWQIREAHQIASFLGDALVLNNVQRHAVEYYTLTERQALALAATAADQELAQREYLLAVHRVLAVSQQKAYLALRQQLAGTTFPLDGPELAAR